jgi:uncharacterized protein with von Willebrand factor type A (vWA) domain
MCPPEGTLDQVMAHLGMRYRGLARNLVQFAALLNAGGLATSTTQLVSAAQAVTAIDVTERSDFRAALSACFVSRAEERGTFDFLFDRFWRLPREAAEEPRRPEPVTLTSGDLRRGMGATVDIAYARDGSGHVLQSEASPQSYSGEEAFLQKDFATFHGDEVLAARHYIRRLAPKLATETSRRSRRAVSGSDIDLRRSLRLAARAGGELMHLARRRRRVQRVNTVLLCDVSGSMDAYSRFLAQFLYGLQQEFRGIRTFVFSTRLFDVTLLLRARTFEQAVAHVGRDVDGWSGGTRIGACLAEFNRTHARRIAGQRTVLVMISDGWDRGDVAQLEEEMRMLRHRVGQVLWLNPLLGNPDYRPVAQGMSAALPYIDAFLPVHNLESLARVGRSLLALSRR